jgi:hypothetical protein
MPRPLAYSPLPIRLRRIMRLRGAIMTIILRLTRPPPITGTPGR